MRRFTVLLVLALIAAACSSSDSDSTATSTISPTSTTSSTGDTDETTTTVSLATTTTTAATTTTSVAGEETTTTTGGTTGTTAGDSSAVFVISRVIFGSSGYVSVTNVGDATGNLEGWQLCQRPAYFRIGSIEVAPGETVHFTDGEVDGLSGQVIDANGRFGNLQAGGGEIALYVDGSFGSASSIRSYVEWGSSPHGRSSVAVEAGIWTEGGFVPAEGTPGLAARVDVATSPADWATS